MNYYGAENKCLKIGQTMDCRMQSKFQSNDNQPRTWNAQKDSQVLRVASAAQTPVMELYDSHNVA